MCLTNDQIKYVKNQANVYNYSGKIFKIHLFYKGGHGHTDTHI